jgi:cholesterol oxidase
MKLDYDYIIIGSGFGGAVSALRLTEKGYRVLIIEKGRRFAPDDFPKTNWNLRKWLWLPGMRFFGIFKMTFLRHVGILSGVGVGGGSLVYANTLPRPESAFFNSGSWAGLADWEKELESHYNTAEEMLGATQNPELYDSDQTLRKLAERYGQVDAFEPTKVAVFFGEPEKFVKDPYFNGEGPDRAGCTHCGACMTGCRFDAKNTLDKNYLFLAEKGGAKILADSKVLKVSPLNGSDGKSGYSVYFRGTASMLFNARHALTSKNIIFAGGVLGTVRLLLNLKESSLPGISDHVGDHIRTNNESLVLVHSRDKTKDFSKGIAIGSIFPPDSNTHLEAVRYGSGSGFWKMMGVPLVDGKTLFARLGRLFLFFIRKPWSWLRILFSRNFAKESLILLFMQHLDSTLKFKRGWGTMRSAVSTGEAPSAYMPLAMELAQATSEEIKGTPFVMLTETITGMPVTAHILGGAVIGKTREEGVIDENQKVFGYENMYICDGSAVSANPGVNPALTITAMTERVMSRIPNKK